MTSVILVMAVLVLPVFLLPGYDALRLPKEILFQVVALSVITVVALERFPARIPRVAWIAAPLLLLACRSASPSQTFNLVLALALIWALSVHLTPPLMRTLAAANLLPAAVLTAHAWLTGARSQMGWLGGDVDTVGCYLALTALFALRLPVRWLVLVAVAATLLHMHTLTAGLALMAGLTVTPHINRRIRLGLAAVLITAGLVIAVKLPQIAPDRLDAARVALVLWAKSPFLGNGVATFRLNFFATASAMARSGSWGNWAQAHNEYAQVAAELGLIGLLLAGALVWHSLARQPDRAPLVGFLVAAMAFFPAHVALTAFWGCLAAAVPIHAPRRRHLPAPFALGLVLLFAAARSRPLLVNDLTGSAAVEVDARNLSVAISRLETAKLFMVTPDLHRVLGVAYFAAANPLAVAEFRAAYRLAPSETAATNLAAAAMKFGRVAASQALLTQTLNFNPINGSAVQLSDAVTALAAGRRPWH